MNAGRSRSIAVAAGAAALVAMGSLTACSPTTEKEAPSTTATTSAPSSSAPAPSPTEKAMLPGGDESFTPTINPTPPGAVCKQIVNGVCMR